MQNAQFTGIAILLPCEEKIDKISSEIAPGNTPGNSPGNTPGNSPGNSPENTTSIEDNNDLLPPYILTVDSDENFPVTANPDNEELDKKNIVPLSKPPLIKIQNNVKFRLIKKRQNHINCPNSKVNMALVSSDSSQWSYHAVSMHMDHDEKLDLLRIIIVMIKVMTDGYNHRGTDIMLWPFSWNMMDDNIINVVAATDGIIIHKMDEQRDCSIDSKDNISNAFLY